VPLNPTTTLPMLIGLVTLNVVWFPFTADPVSGTLKFEFKAFDVTDTLPLKFPADCGANVTLNDVLCPGVRVTGVNPETLNPVPLAATCVTWALEPPVLVTVSVCIELWPTCTFVNVRLVGFGVKIAGATPIPDNAMSTDVPDPLTVSDRLPLLAPAAAGVKLMPKVEAWFGARVSGKVNPA